MNDTQLRQYSSNTSPERHHHHHHHHHHEDGADKFRRQMKNEKRRWELMGKITFYVLIVLVVMTFAFLMWSYDII
ncbi:unknown [Prevotella sp. CAG:1092]|nr:hypothetical protein [Prevotella sp.]MDD7708473.1 hypothetical protein [Prevotella sp.]MDY4150140.1 hypothetical protein [Prevotella sp.]CCZ11773.1 unknown [Prevotella sp. CAG:1092]